MTRTFLFALIFCLSQVFVLKAHGDGRRFMGLGGSRSSSGSSSSVKGPINDDGSAPQPAQPSSSQGTSMTPEEQANFDANKDNREWLDILSGATECEHPNLAAKNCCKNFDSASGTCLDGKPAAAAPAAAPSGSPSSDLTSIGEDCIKDSKDATDTCDFNNSPGARVAVQMANQMRGQLNAASMTSPAAMCSQMGSVSQAIDAAVAAFNGYCTTAYTGCESSCSSDIEQLKAAQSANPTMKAALDARMTELKAASRSCSKLSSNVAGVFQNIGSYAALQQAKSQYCGKQVDALAELCKSQPTNMLCKTATSANCADPNVAASSVVCICQANPGDPRCGAQNQVGLQAYNPSAPGAGSGSGADGGAPGDFGGLGGNGVGGAGLNGNGVNGDSAGGGARAGFGGGRGGGMGGLSGGGGGGNGKGGAGGGGAGGNGPNAKIIAGYGYGGSGGGAGSYGGAGNGAAGGPGAGGRNGYGPAGKPGVDLRKFMPGGQMDPSRGLAGVSGPDGITGPNTDIWQKIQMRYYSVGPSLMP